VAAVNRDRHKVEVPEAEFNQFLKDFPRPLDFDGMRYTDKQAGQTLTWHKPVAVKENGKFYLVKE
jgi:hypothetical protein